jgi:hypothetical protein
MENMKNHYIPFCEFVFIEQFQPVKPTVIPNPAFIGTAVALLQPVSGGFERALDKQRHQQNRPRPDRDGQEASAMQTPVFMTEPAAVQSASLPPQGMFERAGAGLDIDSAARRGANKITVGFSF